MLLGKTLHFRQARNLSLDFLGQGLGANSEPSKQRWHYAVRLRHQSLQQVDWLYLLILVARRHVVRLLQRFLRFHCHLFKSQHV